MFQFDCVKYMNCKKIIVKKNIAETTVFTIFILNLCLCNLLLFIPLTSVIYFLFKYWQVSSNKKTPLFLHKRTCLMTNWWLYQIAGTYSVGNVVSCICKKKKKFSFNAKYAMKHSTIAVHKHKAEIIRVQISIWIILR